jgi:hypothetical protein
MAVIYVKFGIQFRSVRPVLLQCRIRLACHAQIELLYLLEPQEYI